MTRKLSSLLLSAFALLLLMGAGVEQDSTDGTSTSSGLTVAQLSERSKTSDQEADQAQAVPAAAGQSVLTLAEDKDRTLTVNGQAVSSEVSKTQRNGTTYVALASMAKELDPTVNVQWNAGSQTVTITSGKLNLSAQVGQLYLVANGRYLYIPEGVQAVNGQVTVPLSVVTEAFGATLSWNVSTGVVAVTRGSGGIQSGEQYYNSDDLFWLSRVIYAESGNQPLEGQMAVGNVILNRVSSPIFPNSILGVLSQKNQFTTYQSGRLANRTPNASSVIAAKLVLDGGVVEETEGAMYFDSTPNSWASRNKTCVAVIGGHRFYA
jgi:N-acetylmuramoyl-L-alanine amidase